MPRVDARVNHRDRDAASAQRPRTVDAGPHLIGANRFGGGIGGRPDADVARQMIHRRILLQRVKLPGVHGHDRAAGQRLLDCQVIAGDERGDLGAGPVKNDLHRLRPGRKMVGQIRTQTGAVRGAGRCGHEHGDDAGHAGHHAARRRAQLFEGQQHT